MKRPPFYVDHEVIDNQIAIEAHSDVFVKPLEEVIKQAVTDAREDERIRITEFLKEYNFTLAELIRVKEHYQAPKER